MRESINKKTKYRLLFVLCSALTMVPALVFADGNPPQTQPSGSPAKLTFAGVDMSLAETRGYIPGFNIIAKNWDKNKNPTNIVIVGKAWKSCFADPANPDPANDAQQIQIRFRSTDDSTPIVGSGDVNPSDISQGFELYDPTGQGRTCLADPSHSCVKLADITQASKCVRLDTLGGQKDISTMGTGDVGLVKEAVNDPNPSVEKTEPIIVHRSSKQIEDEAIQAAAVAKQGKIDYYKEIYAHCNSNLADLDQKERAAKILVQIDHAEYANLSTILASIDKDRVKLTMLDFTKRIAAAKSADDILSIRDDLDAIKGDDAYSGQADKMADLYVAMAHKLADADPKKKRFNFSEAQATIADAQEISGLSDSKQTSLDEMQTQIQIGNAAHQADSGWQNNYALYGSLQSLIPSLQKNYQSSCTISPNSSDMTACTAAQTQLQYAMQLPTQAQKVDQNKQQMMQQMQQMMGGTSQSMYGNQMSSGYNPYSGYTYGLNAGGMTPSWAGGSFGSQVPSGVLF
jgi:hypothetical protein